MPLIELNKLAKERSEERQKKAYADPFSGLYGFQPTPEPQQEPIQYANYTKNYYTLDDVVDAGNLQSQIDIKLQKMLNDIAMQELQIKAAERMQSLMKTKEPVKAAAKTPWYKVYGKVKYD